MPGWLLTNAYSGHQLSLFQPPSQAPTIRVAKKTSYKNAKLAWREGPASGCEWHVIWAADGCQCLPPTPHLMSRPAGKHLLYDSIIKQVHQGGSSLVNIKEKNEDSGHYLAHRLSLYCPLACFFSFLLEVISLLSNYPRQLEKEFASSHVLSRDHQ